MEVDFGKKIATCKVDSQKFDSDDAIEKLVAAGFEQSALVQSAN